MRYEVINLPKDADAAVTVPVSKVNSGKVITVPAHKLAYCALPKAACSSVKAALARLDPRVSLPPAEQVTVDTWHALYPTRRFRPHRWEAVSDHWRFCVARDPARRLMSCYTDLVQGRRILRHSKALRHFDHLTPTPDPDHFFSNLRAYAKWSSVVRHHVLEAWLFLGPRFRAHYDRVYTTATLADLSQDLSAQTGCDVTLPHANSSRTRLRVDDLSGATIDAIRPFLEAEYTYYDGLFTNPLGPRLHGSCAIHGAGVS